MIKILAVLTLIVVVGVVYLFGPTMAREVASPPPSTSASTGAATPKPTDASVVLTEAVLTERLNQRLAGQSLGATPIGSATLGRLDARLRDGEVRLDGDMRVSSRDVPLSLSSGLNVERERAVVELRDAKAAGVPLPEPVRQSLQEALQQQVDQEVQRHNIRVSSITIGDGKLVISGRPTS